eukprot:CAMPEP_0170339960 /NCGR_PEP_ID=MMETSP0116_2-20130129/71061_1 /TAXON_ID=400756 /ORGANISM="Durinskia baltica, Strain CSIRO CS-38" /LENGTH=109 /DNA_ID=CAMNT_0010593425 /DNA_START=27 /DNA_END=353 /DNA_ORIENTATION=+
MRMPLPPPGLPPLSSGPGQSPEQAIGEVGPKGGSRKSSRSTAHLGDAQRTELPAVRRHAEDGEVHGGAAHGWDEGMERPMHPGGRPILAAAGRRRRASAPGAAEAWLAA